MARSICCFAVNSILVFLDKCMARPPGKRCGCCGMPCRMRTRQCAPLTKGLQTENYRRKKPPVCAKLCPRESHDPPTLCPSPTMARHNPTEAKHGCNIAKQWSPAV